MLTILNIYIVVLIPLALMARTLTRTAYRWLFTVLHGALLTVLTVSCANTNPLFLAEEAEALSIVGHLRQYLSADAPPSNLLPTDNFILVDVSHDTQLLTMPQQRLNGIYPAVTSGVDRQRLTAFLNAISHDSTLLRSTDLIVCDVLFDYPTDSVGIADLALLKSLSTLSGKQKLLVAQSVQPSSAETSIPHEALEGGLVDIALHDGLFFNYQLSDATGKPSLPRRMYERLQARHLRPWTVPGLGIWLEETAADAHQTTTVRWGLNTFIPELRLTDAVIESPETQSGEELMPAPSSWLKKLFAQLGKQTAAEQGIRQISLPVYELGELLNQPGLLGHLVESKAGKQNIILIGSFSDAQRDVHQTAFGEMHGPVLLLNVYQNLLSGAHLLTGAYLSFLFIMFSLLSHQMLRNKIEYQPDALSRMLDEWKRRAGRWLTTHTSWFSKQGNRLRRFIGRRGRGLASTWPHTTHFGRQLQRRITDIARLILEEAFLSKQPYWLLLITLSVSVLYFNHVINIMGLAIYVAAIDFSLRILKRPQNGLSTQHTAKYPLASHETSAASAAPAVYGSRAHQ